MCDAKNDGKYYGTQGNTPDRNVNNNARVVNQTPRMLLKNLEQKTVDLIMVREKELYEMREMLRAINMAAALLG